MNDLISICIPVYNSEKTIEQTIKSALSQTYQNIEIIVVDNCSIDTTWEILNSFKDMKIKIFQNETNIGMVANWNKCLDYANGKYVHFLCGDDLIAEDCIQKKIAMAEKSEDIVMVFSASEVINEAGEVVFLRRQFKTDCILDGKKIQKKSFLSKNIFGEPSNVLIKKAVLEKSGKFATNLVYSIDWELWIRISVLGRVGFISKPLMKYRISKSNGTSQLKKKAMLADDNLLIKNLKDANFKFSKFDILRHRFMMVLRMYARLIFMKIKG